MENLLDLFFISETKLDRSFPNAQFQVPGFKHYRVDRNAHGGGIAAHIRSDLPHRRRPDLESMATAPVEAFVIEIMIRNEVWIFICMYSPHFKHKMACCGSINAIIDACQSKRPTNIFVVGDLNINFLNENESRCLKDAMDVYGLYNLIDTPTCYKSVDPTLIDVILTSQRRRIASTLNVTTGISYVHNLIACSTKMHVPRNGNKNITNRSYKHFNKDSFKYDMDTAPFYVGNIFDDVDDIFWFNHTLIQDIINGHAPMKQKKTVKQPVPFMNSKLRKACLHKAMLRNSYFKHGRTNQSWERYRKSRNNVTKLKAVSMNTYFHERCNSDSFRNNPRQYWRTIKPYMTDKCKTSNQDISLFHENKLVNDPIKVCKIFNDYFIKAASNIGNEEPIRDDETVDDILCMYKDCEVIQRITSNVPHDGIFRFSFTSVKDVKDLLKKTDPTKATGYDDIPPKLLQLGATELAPTITNLINQSIEKCRFPTALKQSELSPLYKSKDNLITDNYRPLSILPCYLRSSKGYSTNNYMIISNIFCRIYYPHFVRSMDATMF